MKLSELPPDDIEDVSSEGPKLSLSQQNPDEISVVEPAPDKTYTSGGLDQQAMAFLESAAKVASIGGSDAALIQLGLTTPEDIRARELDFPLTKMAGGVAGGVGLLTGLGAMGVPIAAGITARLGGGTLATMAGWGAENAALFGTGQIISDLALGDVELNAQTIASELGSDFLFGGALGGFSKAIGAAPALARKGFKAGKEAIFNTAHKVQGAITKAGLRDVPLTKAEILARKSGAPPLRDSLPLDALSEADQAPIIKGLNNLKENAEKIITSGEKLGAAVPEGNLIKDEHGQKLEFSLTQSPSIQGVERNRLYRTAYEDASNKISETLGKSTEASLAETGIAVKDSLTKVIESKYAPIEALYNDIAAKIPEQVPITDPKAISKSVFNLIEAKSLIEGTPAHTFVKNAARGFLKIDNLQKLRNFRTALREASDYQTYQVYTLIKETLDGLGMKSIEAFANKMTDLERKADILSLIGDMKNSSEKYAKFKDELETVSKLIWGRKTWQNKQTAGSKGFLKLVEEEKVENLATRLFAKKDSKAMKFMKEEFPEVVSLLSEYEKVKLRKLATLGENFRPKVFLNELYDMEKELRELIFTPEELEMFGYGKTYFDAFLKNYNPSGSAGAIQYNKFIEHPMSYLTHWAKDLGIEAYIKHTANLTEEQIRRAGLAADQTVRIKGITNLLKSAYKKIEEGTKAVLSSPKTRGGVLGGYRSLSNEKYDENVKSLEKFRNNPASFIENMSENTTDLHTTAPNITTGLYTTVIRAGQFLSSKIPQSTSQFTLSYPFEPSDSQKQIFNEYYEAVNDPFKVFEQMQNGSLSSQTMEALTAVYPDLLNEMRSVLVENMDVDKTIELPYNKKMILSKFLGQPLDGNLTQPGLVSNQIALNTNLSQQSAPKSGRKTSTQGGLKQLSGIPDRASTQTKREWEEA